MWKVLALQFGIGLAEETASLLQTKSAIQENVELATYSARTGQVKKEVVFANATTAKCSCACKGCGVFACMDCPMIACDCGCVEAKPCASCCNGDAACLQKKLRDATAARLEWLALEDKYKIDSDKYRWEQELQRQLDMDDDWKFQRGARKFENERRSDARKTWKTKQRGHQRILKNQKKRREKFQDWKADLGDEVDWLTDVMDGNHDIPPMRPEIDCECPDCPICPPEPKCPRCHEPSCPPCRPFECPHVPCQPCEEDAAIKAVVDRFIAGEDLPKLPDPANDVNCEKCPHGYNDGCNSCMCGEEGHAMCTQMFCFDPQPGFCNEPPKTVDCTTCPHGYYDGCNNCQCGGTDATGACGRRMCFTKEEPRCLEPPEPPTTVDCTTCPNGYYDGCNNCQCGGFGATGACGRRMCVTKEEPRCL